MTFFFRWLGLQLWNVWPRPLEQRVTLFVLNWQQVFAAQLPVGKRERILTPSSCYSEFGTVVYAYDSRTNFLPFARR